MKTATSRLTKKYQATVPEPIRKVLHLNAGDVIAFDVEGEKVRLRKAGPIDLEFASALNPTLNEWMSQDDEEAYGDL
jgi:bifunctional DNA-binding transcriptional regulator/antitoxin component of YhaV-PrlF toxin-antitoxin module